MGKKYKMVAPDGGWGYMIWISVTLFNVLIAAFQPCFGIIYKDFIEEHNIGTTDVTMLNGAVAIGFAVSGFLTGPMSEVVSKRKIALLGTILFNIGTAGAIFVNSVVTLFVTQILSQGVGFGIIYNISCTVLYEYFVERRMLAITVTQTISGMITMVIPLLTQWCLDYYGFRGTLMIIAGLSLHMFIGVTIIHPVEQHMKGIEIIEEDREEKEPLKPSMSEDIILEEFKEVKHVTPSKTDNDFIKGVPKENEELKVFTKLLNSFKDMLLLKSFIFSSACLGIVLSLTMDLNYLIILPQALFSEGWSSHKVSLAISLLNFGDLLTRILMIFINKILTTIGSHKIYIFGMFMAALTKIGVQLSSNSMLTLAIITVMGISRCIVTILIGLVVADSMSLEQLPTGVGLSMLLMGVVGLPFGYVSGTLRDLTNSFGVVFYMFALCGIVIAVMWCAELWCKSRRRRKNCEHA